MTLGQIIKILEKLPKNKILECGFNEPHSYRGSYDSLAFEITKGISVGEMLEICNGCVDKEFTGYKGGDFLMSIYTDCYLAEYGDIGEEITHFTLAFMLGDSSIVD
jgi:hypothetical protein